MSEASAVAVAVGGPRNGTAGRRPVPIRCAASLEALLAPLVALLAAVILFSIFLLALGQSPLDFLDMVWRGAFGSWFSLRNTLQRAAPLLLTALCVALPGQLGLVIIGGEAAVVLGGLAATVAALPLVHTDPIVVQLVDGGGRRRRWARCGSASAARCARSSA